MIFVTPEGKNSAALASHRPLSSAFLIYVEKRGPDRDCGFLSAEKRHYLIGWLIPVQAPDTINLNDELILHIATANIITAATVSIQVESLQRVSKDGG